MKNLSLLFIVFLILHLTTFSQSRWTLKADIPTARSWTESCTIVGKIYVIGGTESTSPLGPSVGTMEVYDPILDSWDTTKEPMPTARVEFVACAVNGKIYAIGGATNHGASPFGMVEEYDPLTNTWDDTTKTPMPTTRKDAAYGVIDNKIYVAGGSTVSNWVASNKLEIYDPETDSWETNLATMNIPMYQGQGAVINDKFYVIGGLIGPPWTGQKTTQIYDPATDIWSLGADLDSGRVGHTTNGVAGKIYAIGGDRQPPPVLSVEEYDPNSNSWSPIDSAPFVKICHTASVFRNAIYVFSGSTTPL
jgi:N-acetylneuraminic acid mutarotase